MRGHSFHLDAHDARVHAVEWRPSDTEANRREPTGHVLLVHGLGAHTLSWEPVGQRLADSFDATVTAVDLLGFGRTRSRGRPATLETNAAIVRDVLEQRGPAVVMGNSMGGIIGINVTVTDPQLVEALVLVNPALPHPKPGLSDWLRIAKLAPLMVPSVGGRAIGARARFLGPERVVDASLAWCLHDPARLDPDLRERFIELAAERSRYPEAPLSYAEAARSLFVAMALRVHAELGQAAATRPTLLLHGERDRIVTVEAARDAAARHPDITLAVLDGLGHAPQLEDPDRVVGVVRSWLEAEHARGDAAASAGSAGRS